jgi:hypothetical protein
MLSEEEEIAKLQAERKAGKSTKADKYAGYDTVLADEEPEDDEPPAVRCALAAKKQPTPSHAPYIFLGATPSGDSQPPPPRRRGTRAP